MVNEVAGRSITEASAVAAVAVVATKPSIQVRNKGKRMILDLMEEEKRCKFQENPLVEKAAMAIEAKRQYHDKQITQRENDENRMEEKEKDLHELIEQL